MNAPVVPHICTVCGREFKVYGNSYGVCSGSCAERAKRKVPFVPAILGPLKVSGHHTRPEDLG